MTFGTDRAAVLAEFVALAVRIERLRATAPTDVPRHDAALLTRWQILYDDEIASAVQRREHAAHHHFAATVTRDELAGWIDDARAVLEPLPTNW